jgi:hypothetical protein
MFLLRRLARDSYIRCLALIWRKNIIACDWSSELSCGIALPISPCFSCSSEDELSDLESDVSWNRHGQRNQWAQIPMDIYLGCAVKHASRICRYPDVAIQVYTVYIATTYGWALVVVENHHANAYKNMIIRLIPNHQRSTSAIDHSNGNLF